MIIARHRHGSIRDAEAPPSGDSKPRIDYYDFRREEYLLSEKSLPCPSDQHPHERILTFVKELLRSAVKSALPKDGVAHLELLVCNHVNIFVICLSTGASEEIWPLSVALILKAMLVCVLLQKYTQSQPDFSVKMFRNSSCVIWSTIFLHLLEPALHLLCTKPVGTSYNSYLIPVQPTVLRQSLSKRRQLKPGAHKNTQISIICTDRS